MPLESVTSLPPRVELAAGMRSGVLTFSVGEVIWGPGQPAKKVAVRLKWWGDTSNPAGDALRPGAPPANAARFAVAAPAAKMAAYLSDCGPLLLEVEELGTWRAVGTVAVTGAAEAAPGQPFTGAFPLAGACGAVLGTLPVSVSLEYGLAADGPTPAPRPRPLVGRLEALKASRAAAAAKALADADAAAAARAAAEAAAAAAAADAARAAVEESGASPREPGQRGQHEAEGAPPRSPPSPPRSPQAPTSVTVTVEAAVHLRAGDGGALPPGCALYANAGWRGGPARGGAATRAAGAYEVETCGCMAVWDDALTLPADAAVFQSSSGVAMAGPVLLLSVWRAAAAAAGAPPPAPGAHDALLGCAAVDLAPLRLLGEVRGYYNVIDYLQRECGQLRCAVRPCAALGRRLRAAAAATAAADGAAAAFGEAPPQAPAAEDPRELAAEELGQSATEEPEGPATAAAEEAEAPAEAAPDGEVEDLGGLAQRLSFGAGFMASGRAPPRAAAAAAAAAWSDSSSGGADMVGVAVAGAVSPGFSDADVDEAAEAAAAARPPRPPRGDDWAFDISTAPREELGPEDAAAAAAAQPPSEEQRVEARDQSPRPVAFRNRLPPAEVSDDDEPPLVFGGAAAAGALLRGAGAARDSPRPGAAAAGEAEAEAAAPERAAAAAGALRAVEDDWLFDISKKRAPGAEAPPGGGAAADRTSIDQFEPWGVQQ